MPDVFNEAEITDLIGQSVLAMTNTHFAYSGEVGEVVRAGWGGDEYLICIEWGGSTEMPPRWEDLSKKEFVTQLKLKGIEQ